MMISNYWPLRMRFMQFLSLAERLGNFNILWSQFLNSKLTSLINDFVPIGLGIKLLDSIGI
jgi:hypothetical protein